MAKKKKLAIESYQAGTNKIAAAAKGGASKQEIRQMVVAHNKLFRGTKNAGKAKINVQKMWSYMPKATESKVVAPASSSKPPAEEAVYSNYGQNTGNKKLTRDETYSDYARSIRGEAPASDLYHGAGGKVMNSDGSVNIEATEENTSSFQKRSAVPKRGYIMKRNRK